MAARLEQCDNMLERALMAGKMLDHVFHHDQIETPPPFCRLLRLENIHASKFDGARQVALKSQSTGFIQSRFRNVHPHGVTTVIIESRNDTPFATANFQHTHAAQIEVASVL